MPGTAWRNRDVFTLAATCFWTEADGWCWFFGAIDHATDELVGWKATKRGDRWAALEPLYQGVRYAFGRLGKDVARGLTVRTDLYLDVLGKLRDARIRIPYPLHDAGVPVPPVQAQPAPKIA